jgi:hypothetical protein
LFPSSSKPLKLALALAAQGRFSLFLCKTSSPITYFTIHPFQLSLTTSHSLTFSPNQLLHLFTSLHLLSAIDSRRFEGIGLGPTTMDAFVLPVNGALARRAEDPNQGKARDAGPNSLSGLVSTLVPVLVVAVPFYILFLLLRRSQRRQYAPRTYLGTLRKE